ncbi:MAG TPA: hypothetical protein VFQ59_00020, partial [Candidatus Paceibacterota bacterium]|nr:hypothetical protein [Candidatus Paceibacterota bacterium]
MKRDSASDQWLSISLPDSPNGLSLFTIDEMDNLYTFVGGRIFVSSNDGVSWNPKFRFAGESMYSLLYNNRLIASFGDESGWFGNNYGVAVSDDQGMTWQWSNAGLPPKFAVALRLAKSGENTYLGTNAAGVFKSTNFG